MVLGQVVLSGWLDYGWRRYSLGRICAICWLPLAPEGRGCGYDGANRLLKLLVAARKPVSDWDAERGVANEVSCRLTPCLARTRYENISPGRTRPC